MITIYNCSQFIFGIFFTNISKSFFVKLIKKTFLAFTGYMPNKSQFTWDGKFPENLRKGRAEEV